MLRPDGIGLSSETRATNTGCATLSLISVLQLAASLRTNLRSVEDRIAVGIGVQVTRMR